MSSKHDFKVGDEVSINTPMYNKGTAVITELRGETELKGKYLGNGDSCYKDGNMNRSYYEVTLVKPAKPQHEPLFVGDSGWRA